MLVRVLLLLTLVATAACSSSSRHLPMPEGPVFQLNPQQWTATATDLQAAREALR
jgi:hypothetical protein